MASTSLNNKLLASNESARSTILDLTDHGPHSFTELPMSSPAHTFLIYRSSATSAAINNLATTCPALHPTGTSSEIETAFAMMSASSAVCHCVEHILCAHALCHILNGAGSGNSGDSVIVAVIFGIFATLILAIFGSSLGSAILSAVKIHSVSKTISKLQESNNEIIQDLADSRVNDQAGARSKAAALLTVEGNKELISAYKHYRASKIAFLVCAIICTLAIAALAAAAVLGVFFSGPLAAAAISAAILGCCAAGGSLIVVAFIGFMIASVYMAKRQQTAVAHLNTATLYAMVADQILNNPEDYDGNAMSRRVTRQVLAKSPQRLFNQMERAYLDIENLLHYSRQTSPTPSAPPPSYADLYGSGLPPSYEEATR